MKKKRSLKPNKVIKHLKEDIKESKKSIAEDKALQRAVKQGKKI